MTESSWNDIPEVTTAVLQQKILVNGLFTGNPLYNATLVLITSNSDKLGNSAEEDEVIIQKYIDIAKQFIIMLEKEINGQYKES